MLKNKGFTLFETMVVALIASFIGMGVITAVASSNKILNDSVKQAVFNGNIDFIMMEISRDVKEGQELIMSDDVTMTENGVTTIYQKSMIIRDKTGVDVVKWYSESRWLYRLDMKTNYKKTYDLIGTSHANTYIEPHFRKILFGAHNGVDMRILLYVRYSNQWFLNNTATNKVYCRASNTLPLI